ncbi:MAG: glycosyltransferase family 4 protein [Chloroflexota bacterium]|nr:glycosyltransferase family 4 protein [Chloroflexota bacterium]
MARRSRLVYVTDLALRQSGGGAYAVNWHAADFLAERFDVTYAGPIVPRSGIVEQAASKVRRRILRRPGLFTYFSPTTLDGNARMVNSHFTDDMDAVMFRSSTRWCRCRPRVPYFVYLDAVFHTFFYNTFSPRDFIFSDLKRIWDEEAEFLEGAAGVFFEAKFGLDEAREAYELKGGHYLASGRGGVIDPPAGDSWDGQSQRLVTIAMNWRQKGGDIVLDAYRQLKRRFPALTWHIVGGPPDGDWRQPGVTYEGVLHTDRPAERSRLVGLLANAFLLVHPTREDVSPLVLTEAAYFGCPAVSVNLAGIPELVINNVTGILVSPPASAESVAAAIAELLDDRERYLAMRKEARLDSLTNHSWERAGAVICDTIARRLGS